MHGLDRINEILKLLIQQLDVLETMTPLDFLDFRDLLMPASGFQSMQFRTIEARLGLKREGRLLFDERAFDDRLTAADTRALPTLDKRPKLVEQLDAWLARTPFIAMGDFDFAREYRKAVKRMLESGCRARARQRGGERGPAQARGGSDRKGAQRIEAIFAAVAPGGVPLAHVAAGDPRRAVH